eukprot:351435-Chlamydomonas_euryale.AAC.1
MHPPTHPPRCPPRVKISMRFEGRQMQFKEAGKEVLLRFIELIGDAAKPDGPLSFRSGSYSVVLAPSSKSGGGGGGGGASGSSRKDSKAELEPATAAASPPPSGSPPPLPP